MEAARADVPTVLSPEIGPPEGLGAARAPPNSPPPAQADEGSPCRRPPGAAAAVESRMHRRPTLTQHDGLFRTTRFILYGNRVRVIRTSPLVRDDQYIPIEAVDPDERVTRRPDLRDGLLASLLLLPSLVVLPGLVEPLPAWAGSVSLALAMASVGLLLVRGGLVRTYVEHGALQLRADVPDATAVRHFVARIVDASREQLARGEAQGTAVSAAAEIRRLHAHLAHGLLTREGFDRHKLRVLRGIKDHVA